MIGSYDFCGHYEWSFAWLESLGGETLLEEYWDQAISRDASMHAWKLIVPKGIPGMREYWQHSLEEEAAGYHMTSDEDRYRIDMHQCPSKGYLILNDLFQHRDYCDHCIGWIGPMMKAAGFVVHHEHNHCGQCWWEFTRAAENRCPSLTGEFSKDQDVRLRAGWSEGARDVFRHAVSVQEKQAPDTQDP